MRGRFITLEGIDGAGKSTQLPWLARRLEKCGIAVAATREPGGTALGERLRELLLDHRQRLAPETETLLMFAARREHLERLILPALDRGTWVLCDRFTDATFAYQAGGSGVAWEKVAELERWVHPDLQPDLTFLFDLDPVLARSRAVGARSEDRFEREALAYFTRVREGYLARARADAARVHVIRADRGVDEVREALEAVLASFCERAGR